MDIFINDRTLLSDVEEAKGFTRRLLGLMFKSGMSKQNALFIPGCNWVHTLFMKFPLSVLYLDKNYSVLDIQHYVKPWKVCRPRLSASHVLEFKAGIADLKEISKGDILRCIA